MISGFNLNSCAGCHASTDSGGTSPLKYPQSEMATKAGAFNDIPSFCPFEVRYEKFVLSSGITEHAMAAYMDSSQLEADWIARLQSGDSLIL